MTIAAPHVSQRPFAAYLAEVCESGDVRRGVPVPLGAQALEGGVNFALFSRDAVRVRLELFRGAEDVEPCRIIELDRVRNRTGDVWHVWVEGVPQGQLYAYRVDGPHDPQSGQCFNFDQLLLDPCATAIKRPAGDAGKPKCVVTAGEFDWREDTPLRRPWSQTVIYETHVRGLTVHPSSQVRFPGTYRGLTEKIPYLKELGVTAVELMPVQEFDARQCAARDPATGETLRDYWGYEPVAFFAPNGAYSSAGDGGGQVLEFKEMVRELHAAGIEVIIDIVLDHTAESDEHGPTLSWRGIDNPIYYCLGSDKRQYVDATGCGNTINANHPVVRQLIVGALRYWVLEMHVDGFRFDLASILGRDSSGKLLSNPPLLEQIAEDPILRDTKLIAEAWDAAGAYQVGSFSERRWAEWNGRYRDDVRRFWRGDAGTLAAFANRVCGSEDLYAQSGKGPECSVNFVTCHDGFTLNDLVSFHDKHNLENGEANRDGADENHSANYGVEGPTEDGAIDAVRNRQVKNFLFTLFVSRGVPMLLGGDEFRRTQRGNNNAYCQDNEISWYDWRDLQKHADIHDFVMTMAAIRRAHPVLSREEFYSPGELRWVTPRLGKPDWSGKAAGCLIREGREAALYLMFNAENKPMSFLIPPPPERRRWQLAIDTSTDLPASAAERPVQGGEALTLAARSSVLLVSTPLAGEHPKECVARADCDPLLDVCAEAMGGEDPAAAYAAAMLWYQGYPEQARDEG
jgi:glycogen operon protein